MACNWDPQKHNGKPCPIHGSNFEGEGKHYKRIEGGKMQLSGDNQNWNDTDYDTYHELEADLDSFDENTDDDFGLEENKPANPRPNETKLNDLNNENLEQLSERDLLNKINSLDYDEGVEGLNTPEERQLAKKKYLDELRRRNNEQPAEESNEPTGSPNEPEDEFEKMKLKLDSAFSNSDYLDIKVTDLDEEGTGHLRFTVNGNVNPSALKTQLINELGIKNPSVLLVGDRWQIDTNVNKLSLREDKGIPNEPEAAPKNIKINPLHQRRKDENGFRASTDGGKTWENTSEEEYNSYDSYSDEGEYDLDLNDLDLKIEKQENKGKGEALESEYVIKQGDRVINEIPLYNVNSAFKKIKSLIDYYYDTDVPLEEIKKHYGV